MPDEPTKCPKCFHAECRAHQARVRGRVPTDGALVECLSYQLAATKAALAKSQSQIGDLTAGEATLLMRLTRTKAQVERLHGLIAEYFCATRDYRTSPGQETWGHLQNSARALNAEAAKEVDDGHQP